ncbi:hypothetical protein DR64_8062 [Paraburkholderia xenovorans LB400]|uniref:Uncharacterized protein n=1 Tax=Paraburkholderia xenovorans (strain LB400) TaxID=266265 RepID=Q13I03_PARXL|nr:hypothetical protein Bxe_C0379 [Paraburkholderia xenovorans LB400]AIP34222.1 hypothetical protein DR64_8062 [Paraburkholderia xenovorans LB400]
MATQSKRGISRSCLHEGKNITKRFEMTLFNIAMNVYALIHATRHLVEFCRRELMFHFFAHVGILLIRFPVWPARPARAFFLHGDNQIGVLR